MVDKYDWDIMSNYLIVHHEQLIVLKNLAEEGLLSSSDFSIGIAEAFKVLHSEITDILTLRLCEFPTVYDKPKD